MKNRKEYEDISATVEELKNAINELANSIREFGDYIKELMNDTDSYTDLALKTLNKDVFEQKDLILNASLGLSGEVGEVNDIIKKYMYHGHKLDDDTKEKIMVNSLQRKVLIVRKIPIIVVKKRKTIPITVSKHSLNIMTRNLRK